ncbi:hypothetical protein RRG08_036852 [Elysia crispata]|nr:hypothetical protein RRG08_036852 [Elysia crispata]
MSTKTGITSLMMASRCGHLDIVKALLKQGKSVDFTAKDGWTALMQACFVGNIEIVEVLLANKASASMINIEGRTALAIAESNKHYNIIHTIANHLIKVGNMGVEPNSTGYC